MIKIRRGMKIPLSGEPAGPAIAASSRHVALVGPDYVGMKPTMVVSEGDQVQKGQVVFTDKKMEGVKYTSPASGRVSAINRGARRVFQSLVVEVDDTTEPLRFEQHSAEAAAQLDASQIRDVLIESGQ